MPELKAQSLHVYLELVPAVFERLRVTYPVQTCSVRHQCQKIFDMVSDEDWTSSGTVIPLRLLGKLIITEPD
ncbi:MAG: hypothetical protein ABFS56_25415 [Pseudomonadota bacterium]